jgi:hypothetical protein
MTDPSFRFIMSQTGRYFSEILPEPFCPEARGAAPIASKPERLVLLPRGAICAGPPVTPLG